MIRRVLKLSDRPYWILYLAPDRLIEHDKLLKLQKDNSKTFLDKIVIPALFQKNMVHNLRKSLNMFEEIFSGLVNTKNASKNDVIGRVASLWYTFTKTAHASLGPRVGNFTEQLITYWIKKYSPNVEVYTNITLSKCLSDILKVSLPKNRAKIDFVIFSSASHVLSLIELRISEHTGGRTGQESLMDKLVKVLNWLEESDIKLREVMVNAGYNKLILDIAILFSEKDYGLLSEYNYSKGRFTSLRKYIIEDRHFGGVLKKLIEIYGYEISYDSSATFRSTYSKEALDNALKIYRKVYLRKDNFIVELSILWGDDFFRKYVGRMFCDLIEELSKEIADDIWLFFSIVINEFKVLHVFNVMNIHKLYKFLTEYNRSLINKFLEIYTDEHINSLSKYFRKLDNFAAYCVMQFLDYVRRKGIQLRLLETNDVTKQLIYLKQLCLVALAMYYYHNLKEHKTQYNIEKGKNHIIIPLDRFLK